MKKQGLFFSGTSNLVLPVPNKSHFPLEYRDKSRLVYYASLFNSIEINSSFYRIPQRKTLEKWSDSVPDHFQFSFKMFRQITHQNQLRYSCGDIDRFLFAVDGAGKKKGCLLLQLPGGIKADRFHQLELLLADIAGHSLSKGWKLAVEFRDLSWDMSETFELLNEFDSALVYQDMPKKSLPPVPMNANWVYLRYHGPTGNYRGAYTENRLTADSELIARWRRNGKTVYAYFNNTLGEAVSNLQTLKRLAGDQISSCGLPGQ